MVGEGRGARRDPAHGNTSTLSPGSVENRSSIRSFTSCQLAPTGKFEYVFAAGYSHVESAEGRAAPCRCQGACPTPAPSLIGKPFPRTTRERWDFPALGAVGSITDWDVSGFTCIKM